MLDESCPKCGTPLFYIKEVGLKYCPKCDIYVATLEEIENAKIDKSKLKLINIDEVEKEEKGESLEIKKLKPVKSLNEKVIESINELILVIIEKLILLMEKKHEGMNINSLLSILERLINIANRIKNFEEGKTSG